MSGEQNTNGRNKKPGRKDSPIMPTSRLKWEQQPQRFKPDGQPVPGENELMPQESIESKAFEMKLKGATDKEIMIALGFGDRDVVVKAIEFHRRHLVNVLDQKTREDHLVMELERLDALQYAVWDEAMSGDIKAVEAALKVINQRARLLKLGELPVDMNRNTTIIVSHERYLEQMRELAGSNLALEAAE